MARNSVWIRTVSAVALLGAAVACHSTGDGGGGGEGNAPKTLAKTDVAPGTTAVEQDALAILERAAAKIRDSQSLSVTAHSGFEVLQESGEMIEFGNSWTATIQRPNRARMESQRRDGVRTQIFMDGNDLWMYSPGDDVWGTEPQVGDIDASFKHLISELGVSTPLANLFSDEFGASLHKGLTSCYLIGDSTIAGHLCHHVAVRNDYVDYQVWIDKGELPLLRRLVINYREEEGRPEYWAYFTDWSFDVKSAPGTFIFQPPAGAEQIRLAHASEGEE